MSGSDLATWLRCEWICVVGDYGHDKWLAHRKEERTKARARLDDLHATRAKYSSCGNITEPLRPPTPPPSYLATFSSRPTRRAGTQCRALRDSTNGPLRRCDIIVYDDEDRDEDVSGLCSSHARDYVELVTREERAAEKLEGLQMLVDRCKNKLLWLLRHNHPHPLLEQDMQAVRQYIVWIDERIEVVTKVRKLFPRNCE